MKYLPLILMFCLSACGSQTPSSSANPVTADNLHTYEVKMNGGVRFDLFVTADDDVNLVLPGLQAVIGGADFPAYSFRSSKATITVTGFGLTGTSADIVVLKDGVEDVTATLTFASPTIEWDNI